MRPCSENRHFGTLILGHFVIKWNLGYQLTLKRPWHKDSEIHLFIPSTKSQAINEISGNSNLLSGGIWWWEIHCVCLPDVSYIILQSHIPTSVNINRAYLPSSIQSSRIRISKTLCPNRMQGTLSNLVSNTFTQLWCKWTPFSRLVKM